MTIEHINKTDTLNEGREKLNAAIDGANAADVTSKAADTKATQALANSESTQTQLDTIVIDGDSSVEAAQARVDEKGEPHPTLKARIDDGMNSVNQQLAQTVDSIGSSDFAELSDMSVWEDIESRGWNLRWFEYLVPNRNVLTDVKDWDWTEALRTVIDLAQSKGNPNFGGSQYPDDSYGSKIYVPRGYYSIYDNFDITGSGIEIVGETKFSSLFYYKGNELSTEDYIFNIRNDNG